MKTITKRSRNRIPPNSILPLLLCCGMTLTAHAAEDGNDVSGHITLANGKNAKWVAVWLQGSAKGVPLKKAQIDQRDKTFLPHVLVVTTGTKVEFPNNDVVFHNVFAYFEAKRFDLGMYPRGSSRSEIFPKPGIVSVLCNVHPQMSAYVVVVDTPYFATTTPNGDFSINHVPPGNYQLHAWHESGLRTTKQITVAAGSPPVALVLDKR